MSENNVALTILSQLGGMGRLKAMIGAHSFTSGERSLTFKWKAKAPGKVSAVNIELDPSDTYTVRFYRMAPFAHGGETSMVYADQLVDLFEAETGLRLSL